MVTPNISLAGTAYGIIGRGRLPRSTTMTIALLTVTLAFVPVQAKVREPNPLAPSIPLLTKEETARIERIIQRFILYDVGKLPGAEGKKALADFQNLGPEAIFPLIDGFN